MVAVHCMRMPDGGKNRQSDSPCVEIGGRLDAETPAFSLGRERLVQRVAFDRPAGFNRRARAGDCPRSTPPAIAA